MHEVRQYRDIRTVHTPANDNDGLRLACLEFSDGLDPDASDIGATTKIVDGPAHRERGPHSDHYRNHRGLHVVKAMFVISPLEIL